MQRLAAFYQEKFVGRATFAELASIRVVVCLILIFYTLTSGAIYVYNIPLTYRVHMGIMDLLYRHGGFEWLVQHPGAIMVYTGVTVLVLVLGAVGLFTRASLIAAAVLYLPLIGVERSYTWFNHAGLIPWYCLVVLCFTPCSNAWSIDRRRRERQGMSFSDEPNFLCGWSRYFVWLVIAAPYVMAGLSKIRNGGPMWWDGVNLQYMLYAKAFTPDSMDRSLILEGLSWLPPAGFAAIGLLTLFSEIGMGLVLFSRWARIILPILCAGMHVGILLTMQIAFWDLIFLQMLVSFDWKFARSLWKREPLPAMAAPERVPSVNPRLPATVLLVLTFVFAGNWVLRGEYYPITSMQMFSHRDRTGKIIYFQVYATSQERGLYKAFLDEMGFGSNRYLPALRKAFVDESGRKSCEEILRKSAAQWNARMPEGARVTSFQIRKLEWNFVKARSDRNYGSVVDTIDVPIEASAPGT